MSGEFVQYCPAIPRLRYRPCPVSRENGIPKTLELLAKHQVVVISGSPDVDSERNKGVGKSYLARNVLEELKRNGKTVTSLNLSYAMGRYGYSTMYVTDRESFK